MDKFLTEMADILEEDEVSPSAELRDFDSWDSLAVLSVVAMADSDFGVTLGASDISDVRTVEDLYQVIVAKQNA